MSLPSGSGHFEDEPDCRQGRQNEVHGLYTIQVKSMHSSEPDNGDCCNCGGGVSYIVLEVNGAEFRGREIDLEY